MWERRKGRREEGKCWLFLERPRTSAGQWGRRNARTKFELAEKMLKCFNRKNAKYIVFEHLQVYWQHKIFPYFTPANFCCWEERQPGHGDEVLGSDSWCSGLCIFALWTASNYWTSSHGEREFNQLSGRTAKDPGSSKFQSAYPHKVLSMHSLLFSPKR